MSLVKIYYLRCNGGCRRIFGDGEREANEARRLARRAGWRRIPRGTKFGLDICPQCLPNHPEAK